MRARGETEPEGADVYPGECLKPGTWEKVRTGISGFLNSAAALEPAA